VCLAMGTDPTALMAELLGRETGVCGGRAGSMNVIDLEHGVLGCFGIVGGSIAAATGAALAAVEKAVAAAEALAAEGIETEVVDLRSLRPLDAQTIAGSVTRTGRLVVVEEGPSFGGYAGEVIAVAAEAGPVRVRRVAMPDVPVPTSGALDDAFITSTGAIAAAARGLVGEPARIG
jgi:hypothetical protein